MGPRWKRVYAFMAVNQRYKGAQISRRQSARGYRSYIQRQIGITCIAGGGVSPGILRDLIAAKAGWRFKASGGVYRSAAVRIIPGAGSWRLGACPRLNILPKRRADMLAQAVPGSNWAEAAGLINWLVAGLSPGFSSHLNQLSKRRFY